MKPSIFSSQHYHKWLLGFTLLLIPLSHLEIPYKAPAAFICIFLGIITTLYISWMKGNA